MTIYKQLFRRGSDFYVDLSAHTVGAGLTYNWTFTNPGWIAFDFMCNVPFDTSTDMWGSYELPNKWFYMEVDGVLRFKARAAWAWTRQWIFVEEGEHEVRFYTSGYDSGDVAQIRRINLTNFPLVQDYLLIESATPPKPMESINTYPILNGWQRYQRTGKRGTELEFVIVFENIDKWRNFMKTLENFYIIKGDYGTYGGAILPQECDTIRQGKLVFMKCKMQSPMTAGVGVDGL